MKRQKKIVRVMVLSISILFVLLTIQTNAVNTTNQGNNNTNQTSSSNTAVNKNTNRNTTNQTANQNTTTKNTNNTNNTANTTNTTKTKSSNANLSNLGIKPHDFTGFKSGTTSYQAVIPEDTETIEVYAKTQDAKATVTGTGKKTLESGDSKLEVVVTAEDGTKKTYTINITRGEQKEDNENLEESNGLSMLKIKDLNLSPEFKTNIYEYTANYIGENTKLEMETIPTNEDYNVEIIGNEDIQEGENIITVLVSEKNGDNVATYQITLNKSLVDEEAIAREEAEKQAKQQKTIIGIVVAVAILIAIIVWIVVKRRNKNIAEEFSGVSLYGKNHQEDEEEEEFPKALREEKAEETSDSQEEKSEEKSDEEEEKSDKKKLEDEEDEIENMPKEQIKEKFLDNYSNYEEEYEAESKEKKKKEKRKGKRFK